MEKVCPHCERPFERTDRRRVRCADCQRAKERDYVRVNRFEMGFTEYREKWRLPERAPSVIDRPLLLGAYPLGGKIFFWKGEPYLAAKYRRRVKDSL